METYRNNAPGVRAHVKHAWILAMSAIEVFVRLVATLITFSFQLAMDAVVLHAQAPARVSARQECTTEAMASAWNATILAGLVQATPTIASHAK